MKIDATWILGILVSILIAIIGYQNSQISSLRAENKADFASVRSEITEGRKFAVDYTDKIVAAVMLGKSGKKE